MLEPTEKQVSESSSNDGASTPDVIAADQEKTMMGQAPFPVQAVPGAPEPIPLDRLDSKVPHKEKEDKSPDEDPFAHLPEHEAAILRRQVEIPSVKVTYFMLYRYATRNDVIIMVVGSICAIAAGAALPLMTIIFGSLTGKFKGYAVS